MIAPRGRQQRVPAIVAGRLAFDSVAGAVVAELVAAEVGVVWLKGPSIARWLYDNSEPRVYYDCDLLVDPQYVERARAVLVQLGFEDLSAAIHGAVLPVEEWHRADGMAVDLHRNLIGIRVSPEEAWTVLSDATETMTVAGRGVTVLAPAARALHVALHAAQHGPAYPQPIEDLRRALEKVPPAIWKEAAMLGARLEALDAMAAGLALVPQGEQIARSLSLPIPTDPEVLLRAGGASSTALFFDRLARTRGTVAKARLLIGAIVPSPTYMRSWIRTSGTGIRTLPAAYVYRLVWLLRRAGTAIQMARRARTGRSTNNR